MEHSSDGFTLIELLIVIAIIGILATTLIPNILSARARAFDAAAASCAKQISTAQEVVYVDNQSYATSLGTLNAVADNMANNCDVTWVDDSGSFEDGWDVEHPHGRGLVYAVGPGGIIPPP